jgi:membrane-bound lytic murein transglycosylase F
MERSDTIENLAKDQLEIDLPEIIKKEKLTVLVENSSTTYFMYRGKQMGFEYELLKLFAQEIGVELEIKIINNLDSLIPKLNRGDGDLIACNYTVTRERNKIISFSEPFIETHQVLVQRKPKGWEELESSEWKNDILTSPSELASKTVHVWKNSSYYQRLMHLQEEIGDSIYIEAQSGNIGGEEMIEMVAEGLIDYTITEDNVANVNRRFFTNLDVNLKLSVEQQMAFGLRKNSRLLKAKLDQWLVAFKKTAKYKYIHHKYFELAHVTQNANQDFSSLRGGKISPYDAAFKRAGKKVKIDWRLVASVAYQESKFNLGLVSFGGAYGIMQFMPSTGPTYDVYPDSPVDVQILGGSKKIKADLAYWAKVKDPIQRMKFAMASYNAGRGHIQDAQNLARKYKLDPWVWDNNVGKMLLNLSKQKYYQDEVVRHGFMRGTNTYRYVELVLERYEQWKTIYPE